LFLFLLIEHHPELIKICLIIALLFCSALISGSEVAFFSLSETDLKKILEEGSNKSKLVYSLRKKPRRLLATILVTNNFINISIVLLIVSLGQIVYFDNFPYWANVVIEIGLITILILLFGELLPKVYANRNPITFSKNMAKSIRVIDKYLVFFITIPMSKITEFIQNKVVLKNNNLSVNKLSDAFQLTDENETSFEEKKILNRIISFGNTEVKQIMKPRIDVFSVAKKTSFIDLVRQVREKKYSRIPVYEDKIDNVIGVIYLKDMFPHIDKIEFNWNSLIKEAYFVPENKKLDDLLKEFQNLKSHLAIVVDEYGGKSGIITLNDIVEEIVGEINDELIIEDINYSIINKNKFIFDGRVSLKDLYKILKINNSLLENLRGDSETLAGFLLEQIGSFPKKNYKIKIKQISFKILDVDRRRIKSVMVSLKND